MKRLIEFPLEEVGSIVVEVDELKFREAERQRRAFEERYRMDFETFEQAWDEGHITDKHTYEAECDYWEWEAAVTDEERLRQMLEELL